MKAKSIVSTGVNIAATTTAVTVQLPFDSSGGRPRYIRVTATGSAYVKLGDSNVVAVPGDSLVQPADGVMLVASGCTYISVITVSGSCAVSVAPTDDGRWDSASPSALDVLRYYGKNANFYLPGVGVLNGLTAGNYIDSAGTTPGAVDQPVGLALSATSSVNASQAIAANRPILRRAGLGPYSWQFDGVDDSFMLGAPLFQMADNFSITVGVLPAANNTYDLVSFASTASANPLIKLGTDSSGYAQFACRDDANVIDNLIQPTPRAGVVSVLSGRKIGNRKVLRVNGVTAAESSNTLGATTFTGQLIGARPVASPSNMFSGNLYPVIAIKGTVTDADLLLLEKFVGSLSGVVI